MSVNPTQSWANQNTALFLLINASTIKTGTLQADNISTGNLYAGEAYISSIDTGLITLDQATLTVQNGKELLLNGIPIATTQNLSSLADWALDPAISTVNLDFNDLISVNRAYVSTINANDFIGNRLNVNQAFISDLTVYQQTTENFASTITLDARSIRCSTLAVNQAISATDYFGRNMYCSSLTTSNIIGLSNTITQTAGSNMTLTAGSNLSLTGSNQANMVGNNGVNINSSNADINIRAPSSNLINNYAVNMSGGDINLNADEGARVDLFSDINLTAGNGNRGRINLTANGGFGNGVYGEVNLTANGGTAGGVGTGGLITLTANTPLGTPSNLTSAIKINAASCLMYSGITAPLASLAGFTYIYGTGGNSIVAGTPPVLPQVPGTNYIWGEFGTTIANDLYTDRILPSFTIAGQDLTIRGRTLPFSAGVRLSNVKSIYMDSPGLISNVGCNIGSNLSYTNGGFNSMLTNFAIIGELTGLPLYNSFISGFRNISCSNLNVSSINNSAYPPSGGGGGTSVLNTFSTASISSLTVSSINNYISLVADSNSQGFIVKGDVPAILLQNTDLTSQQTGLLLAADDNASLIQSFNTSNANPLNLLFQADNFGFNVQNITGGIEMDISGNTQIRHGSLYVSSIQDLQTINGTEQFVFGEFLTTISQTVGGVNTPTTILLDTTNVANGMRESGGLIEVDYTGLYKYMISIQLDKSGGSPDECDFWITVNGNAVANTASKIVVQGTAGETLAVCQYYLSLNANDVVGIVFASSDNSMSATYFPAWTTPGDPYDRPAIPAVIAQMELIK